jgi:plasmid stabilization system protein ParE
MTQTYRIRLSRRVGVQLEEIFEFSAQDSPVDASSLIRQLLDAVDGLRVFPKRQRVFHGGHSPHPTRQLPCANYVIYFEVDDRKMAVTILRVSHGARRRPKRL